MKILFSLAFIMICLYAFACFVAFCLTANLHDDDGVSYFGTRLAILSLVFFVYYYFANGICIWGIGVIGIIFSVIAFIYHLKAKHEEEKILIK